MINGKLLTHLRVWSTHLLFALLSGFVASVILLGALLVGLAGMASFLDITTQPAAGVSLAIQMAAIAVLIASLLATAPLIGWRYNFLSRLFRVDTPLEEAPQ